MIRRDGKVFAVPFHWGYGYLSYNADEVEKPVKYEDLLSPKLTKKIGMPDDPYAVITTFAVFAGMPRPNNLSRAEFDKTIALLKSFRPQVLTIHNYGDEIALFARKDIWVGFPEYSNSLAITYRGRSRLRTARGRALWPGPGASIQSGTAPCPAVASQAALAPLRMPTCQSHGVCTFAHCSSFIPGPPLAANVSAIRCEPSPAAIAMAARTTRNVATTIGLGPRVSAPEVPLFGTVNGQVVAAPLIRIGAPPLGFDRIDRTQSPRIGSRRSTMTERKRERTLVMGIPSG